MIPVAQSLLGDVMCVLLFNYRSVYISQRFRLLLVLTRSSGRQIQRVPLSRPRILPPSHNIATYSYTMLSLTFIATYILLYYVAINLIVSLVGS